MVHRGRDEEETLVKETEEVLSKKGKCWVFAERVDRRTKEEMGGSRSFMKMRSSREHRKDKSKLVCRSFRTVRIKKQVSLGLGRHGGCKYAWDMLSAHREFGLFVVLWEFHTTCFDHIHHTSPNLHRFSCSFPIQPSSSCFCWYYYSCSLETGSLYYIILAVLELTI